MPEHIRILSLSKRFLDAAKDLSQQGRQGWGFPVPHYLAGHAIELALKAHLADSGSNDAALRKLGHDLEKAMARSDAKVLAVLAQDEAAIRWLNPYYAGKELEYTVEGAAGRMISVPDVSFLLRAAQKLHDHLDRAFRGEHRAKSSGA